MPTKDPTLIPRSSPSKAIPKAKPSAKGAGAAVASLGNRPIPLRGTGWPVSVPMSTHSGMEIPGPLQPRPPQQHTGPSPRPRAFSAAPAPASAIPANTNKTHQRFSGSHIPAPLRGSGGGGFGLGLSLPRANADKSSQPKVTRRLPPGPRFHVPLVHSPAAKTQPAMDAGARTTTFTNDDASANKRISNTITAELLLPRSPPLAPTHEQTQQSAPILPVRLSLARTPTVRSDASTESAYTTHSLEYDGGGIVRESESEHGGAVAIRTGQDAEGDQNKGAAMAMQSPGFSMIEAMLEQENRRPSPPAASDADSTCLPNSPSRDDASRASTSTPMPTQRTSPPRDLSISPSLRSSASTISAHDTAMDTNAMANTYIGHAATGMDAAGATSTHLRALTDLKSLLGPVRVSQWIDEARVLQAHQACSKTYSPSGAGAAVFGAPLAQTTHYASCSTVLGAHVQVLPLVVFACIEELYRCGLRSPRLLRPPPHPANGTASAFPALVAAFNSAPTYGDDVDLRVWGSERRYAGDRDEHTYGEDCGRVDVDDVSALLLTYLDCLPAPVMDAFLRAAFVALCVRPGIAHDSEPETVHNSRTGATLRTARLLLRLLPAPHFSLLVYLLAFLSQIPLHESWNGWSVRGVAVAFARVVVGVEASEPDSEVDSDTTRYVKGTGKEGGDWAADEQEAVDVLEWLLQNWDELSQGLFEDEQVGGVVLCSRANAVERKPSRVFSGVQKAGTEREMHRAAALNSLDPGHARLLPSLHSSNGPHIPNLRVVHATAHSTHGPRDEPRLLTRIASLERANSEWRWVQTQHEAELRAMFDEGERQLSELRGAMSCAVEEAVRGERRRWVEEVQALREVCERMARAWNETTACREDMENVVGDIVGRFAKGAPGRV